jgi:CRP-like cAMP-binding protein
MPSTKDQLRALRVLGGMNDTARDKFTGILATIGQPESLPPGTVIFREGEHAEDRGYILLEGDIRVLKLDAPEIVASAPEILGEMAQFNPRALRTATVETAGDVRVLSFAWTQLNDAIVRQCSQDESDAIRQALESYAWEHFTQ